MTLGAPDIEARIAKWEAMVRSFPDSDLPRFSLGQALLDAGRLAEAVAAFREVARLNPTNMMAYVHMGRALLELGRLDEAKTACEEGIRLAIDQGHSGPRADCEAMLAEIEDELG